MTVFGFNTDIKFGDTIYHVQSEDRRHDSLLQTQVFVRGRCIGKHASSYALEGDNSDFTDERMHESLKTQHKTIVDAVRAGCVEEVLHSTSDQCPAVPRSSGPVSPLTTSTNGYSVEGQCATAIGSNKPTPTPALELQFVNPENIFSDNKVCLQFLVTEAGMPVDGAKLVARCQTVAMAGTEATPIYAHSTTDSDGSVQIILPVCESALHFASLLIQATHSAKIVTRKFRLKGK